MAIALSSSTGAPQAGRPVPHTRLGLRWAIYCRISGRQGVRTGDDDDDTVSLDTQEAAIRELIDRLDPAGTIVESLVIREVHTGVELFTRPKLTRLREAVRRGEVDAIACYQPKRWTRDPDHAGYLRSELREYRVTLRYALDDPGDDEAGALVGYVQHWSGKQEHKTISEQTHRARARLVHMGHAWVGCKAPYGLRWRFETIQHPDGRVEHKRVGWDIDPTESAVVAGLFAGLLAGQTLRGMTRDLTERGVLSPKGRAGWTHGVVKDLLESVVYTGEAYGLRYHRDKSDQYVGQHGASAGRLKCRDKLRPTDEWVRLPDGYAPQLVDRRTFDATQQILAGLQRGGREPIAPDVSLMRGGRARCASCGRSLVVQTRARVVKPDRPGKPGPKPKRESGRRIALACQGRKEWDRCLAPAWIAAQTLDEAVKRLARRVYEHPEVIAEQAELHRKNDPTEADLAAVEQTLAEITRQQQSLTLVAAQITDPDAAAPLALRLEQLAKQQRQAQQDRADLLKRRAGWEASQRFLESFAAVAQRVRARLDSFGHAQWQEAIDALQIGAVVQRATAEGDHYRLTMQLEGVVTADLLRKLVDDLKYSRLEAASA
jgi:DNA invertase Pin-like site-specific DNA recombinase